MHPSLADPAPIIAAAMARAMAPPPPADLDAWAAQNVMFGSESPFPGPYDPDLFPFFRRILEVLSPDDETREVTLRGSAQMGKTVLAQVFLFGAMALAPANTLYVHPTLSNADKWVKSKFEPMRRGSTGAARVFRSARARDRGDTIRYKETRDGANFLQITGANSPADLSMISTPRVLMDDLAKWPLGDLDNSGDAETMAVSRASAFDDAKIFRLSTPLVAGACRITDAYERGTREVFDVPCPHCETMQALEWENFRRSIDSGRPEDAHFTCAACGCAIEHKHKAGIVARGRWRATNPRGDHPSFTIWRAYSPTRDWASIAREWINARGIAQSDDAPGADGQRARAASEQVFYNDVLGLPYEVASDAPPWKGLADRAAASRRDVGRIPAAHPMLTAGVDCQGDRIEIGVWAWSREARSAFVERIVIPAPITAPEGRAALDEIVRDRRWRNAAGREMPLDLLAIDEGAYTDDVLGWARRFPRGRVLTVKGGRGDTGPMINYQRGTGRHAEQKNRKDKQRVIANVGRLKSWLYADLRREDPLERGYVDLPRGADDDIFQQMTSERRKVRRNRMGLPEVAWEIVDATRRNEMLDCANYARVAALLCSWLSMSEAEWIEREQRADAPLADPDLFDAPVASPAPAPLPAKPLWRLA